MANCFKRNDESFSEYRERALNTISPSFCGAKWFNATIWLGNGMNASCHHPPAHRIPLAEVLLNPKSLHNTKYKKQIRKQMLEGIRPKECEYCWKIEDLGKENISDRVHKSLIYSDDELLSAKNNLQHIHDVNLKTLEIAFDSICNLACSYCNPTFSTKWQSDIKKNGPYVNLVSDGAGAFQQDGSSSMPFGKDNENNPYVDAFWKWWESDLKYSLQELRITGGEPLMSPNFWKLISWWKQNPESSLDLGVNSNLCLNEKLISTLIDATHGVKKFHLYTSCEATGAQAEYLRDGFSWDLWLNNLESFLSQAQYKTLNCMLTINALCLFSLTDFLDQMIILKKKYKNIYPVCSFNILRFPSFMSVSSLPKSMRYERASHIETWLERTMESNGKYFIDWEKDGLIRLINYLRNICEGHSESSPLDERQRDFKSFYLQYDQRRNKKFIETFPELVDWWESIPVEK